MTEVLNNLDRGQEAHITASTQLHNTNDQILCALDTLYETIHILDAEREAFMQSRPPESIIEPKEFASFRSYCLTLARVGRQTHRDKHEIERTSVKLGNVIAQLHQEGEPVYAKTRPQTPGGAPEYTLGMIIATQAVAVGDYPMENKLALRIQTSNGKRGQHTAQICIDDIAAQLEAHADTGCDTPIVAVGQQAVRGFVEQAYASPRAERSATGVDSSDIFWAMCRSGISLRELGFSADEIGLYKSRIAANLNNVCTNGGTYMHDAPMLPPLCDSIEEALTIIDGTFTQNCPHKIPPQLEQERSVLLDMYLPTPRIIQNI